MFNEPDPSYLRVRDFLVSIGIPVRVEPGVRGFLDNVQIENGGLVVSSESLSVVGNMLHEAGHIAIIPSLFRHLANDDVDTSILAATGAYLDAHPDAFGETEDPIARGILQIGDPEATAWQYAAALECDVDTTLPFRNSYDGEGMDVHAAVSLGRYLGVNGLRAAGMTGTRYDPVVFPKMVRWMQV